jgi:hypothetical protein
MGDMTRIFYKIDGRAALRGEACRAFVNRDDTMRTDLATAYFDLATEQSTEGYVARDYAETLGITIRHAGEEGGPK